MGVAPGEGPILAPLLAVVITWAGTADVRGGPCDRLGVRPGSLVQVTCLALRAARTRESRS